MYSSVSGWESIKGVSDPLVLAYEQEDKNPSSLLITSVGINKYQDENLLLNYAVADAESVADVFSGDVSSASDEKIKTLMLDRRATGENLRQKLTNCLPWTVMIPR